MLFSPYWVSWHSFSSWLFIPPQTVPRLTLGHSISQELLPKTVEIKPSTIFKTLRFSCTVILYALSHENGIWPILLYVTLCLYIYMYKHVPEHTSQVPAASSPFAMSSIPFLPPLGTQCKHSALCHRNPTLMVLLQYSYIISYTFTQNIYEFKE